MHQDLLGIHHVTAITSSAEKIYDFFTYILGLRLVKKTVNQDDIQTYHLFFADDRGNPGTDMTFFDFRGSDKGIHGRDEIARTGFRVPSDRALEYWLKRFEKHQVKHEAIKVLFGRKVIFFEDFDGQAYALFSDENDRGVAPGTPWLKGPIPNEFAIYGLGPIFFNVSQKEAMEEILIDVMRMRKISDEGAYTLFEMGKGGNGGSVILEYQLMGGRSYQGYGSVHHVAFRIQDKQALDMWIDRLNQVGARHSGFVDRFYFKSLYTRMYPNILFEFATEGPGFIDDEEDYEILGEKIALPPKFRNQRNYVESVVRQFDTVRSNKTFEKEYE